MKIKKFGLQLVLESYLGLSSMFLFISGMFVVMMDITLMLVSLCFGWLYLLLLIELLYKYPSKSLLNKFIGKDFKR